MREATLRDTKEHIVTLCVGSDLELLTNGELK
jgi:hypothetical protein